MTEGGRERMKESWREKGKVKKGEKERDRKRGSQNRYWREERAKVLREGGTNAKERERRREKKRKREKELEKEKNGREKPSKLGEFRFRVRL